MPAVSSPSSRNNSSQPDTAERRTGNWDSDTAKRNRLDSITNQLGGFQFSDIFTAAQHSRDFSDARAEYIVRRLRFMLLFFLVAVPAWIFIDYLTMEAGQFSRLATLRLSLTAGLILLILLSSTRQGRQASGALLFASFTAPCLFYLLSMQVVSTGNEVPLAGYSSMPYLMATLLGLFPVTLLFGICSLLMIVATYIGLQTWLGTLTSTESLSTLWVLCMICGIVLWIQIGQLLMLLKLYRESSCDPLTGLINRRVLLKILGAETEKNRLDGETFSILMLDLDRFKRINDNHGHLVGDEVLRRTARILEQELRSGDIIARYGGEEFLAVLPGVAEQSASAVAERIRRAIESAEVYGSGPERLPLSTSIGVVEYRSAEPVEQTIQRADDLLYTAKEQGRNRVVTSFNRKSVD